MKVICPYCQRRAECVSGKEIYPHRPDLYSKRFWLCRSCDAYVGTHHNSRRHAPLGQLADAELRKAKKAAHNAFDRIWMDGSNTRKEAYAWLAEELGISLTSCHIGQFDVEKCKHVVAVCLPVKEE